MGRKKRRWAGGESEVRGGAGGRWGAEVAIGRDGAQAASVAMAPSRGWNLSYSS